MQAAAGSFQDGGDVFEDLLGLAEEWLEEVGRAFAEALKTDEARRSAENFRDACAEMVEKYGAP